MNSKEYIEKAKRTEVGEYQFAILKSERHWVPPRIEHAAMGLVTEAGECMDALKKTKIYGKPFDAVNMKEEMGDVFWYLAIMCDELGITFEEVWEKNIAKLSKRYPEKFTEELALNRNLEAERKTLEGGV
jgi:NTP pyrophosphatase (non-canonical NTP hydrolase)